MNLDLLKYKIKTEFNSLYVVLSINILLFIAMTLMGGSTNQIVLLKFGANYTPITREGEYFRLITNAFLHIGFMHLLFNVYALYQIGRIIRDSYGDLKFWGLYILTAIGGSVLSMTLSGDVISVGASGAVFGFIGVLIGNGIRKNRFSSPIGVDIKQLLVIVVLNLFLGFSTGFIDNWAHIGGLLTGLVLGYLVDTLTTFDDNKVRPMIEKAISIIAILFMISSFVIVIYQSYQY